MKAVALSSQSRRGSAVADLTHLSNLIQGAVIEIREKHPIHEQAELLDALSMFLIEEGWKVTEARNDAMDDLRQAYVDMLYGKDT